MRIKEYKNGWYVIMDKGVALYSIIIRNARGEVHDKIRCDDYRGAMEYWKAFNAIAKNA